MMGRCLIRSEAPKKGYWLFKLSGTRATHIAYMVSDTELIEAAGRDVGVIRRAFRAKDWARWGIPRVFEDEILQPDPPAPVPEKRVKVVGRSVNVRNADSVKGRIMFTAHRGDLFPFIATAPSGWYKIDTLKGIGYITNLPKYTTMEG